MQKTKRKAKERPKDMQPARPKKRKNLSSSRGRKLFHPFSCHLHANLKSNSNRRPKTRISFQPIFLSIVEAKHAKKQY